ncbi:MAG: transposase [Rhodocyclaceae bacterium]|nr:transposase [Rhodocyclaceae bacterium]
MQRNYRFRLYPTAAQEAALTGMLGAFCNLYNAALHERIDCYRKTGRSLGYYDQALQLKAVRAVDERLAGFSFSAEQQLLRRVDKAFKAFFARVKRGDKPGFPRFQAKARFDSIEFRVGDGLTLKKDGRIGLTGLAGTLKVKRHREVPEGAKLGHAILSRNGGHWHVSFLASLPDTQAPAREFTPVGLDLGVANLVALSSGETVVTPQWAREAAAKQRRHQRRIARRKKGSARWRKAKSDYARFARRVANQRRDFLHKLSTGIVREHSHIAVEDLDVRALGRGVLAKDVLNAGWGSFLAMLRYKAESAGSEVEAVDPRNTSQTCSACGSTVPKGLGVRVHDCPHCGYSADRDVNAAQNILLKSSFMRPGSGLRAQSKPEVRVGLAREAVCFS